jgi:membrane protein implicated in regulation of membrane protease activity
MAQDPMFPPAVFVIWWTGLLLTLVVFVPLSVVLLHRLWRTARSIQLYARDALVAAQGIAGNTGQIGALDETIHVAGGLLTAASSIEQKLGAAAGILAHRAERM